MILDQNRRVENSVVGRPQGVDGHMSAVREGESSPCIVCGLMIDTVRLDSCESVQAIIMTCRSVGDVQSRIWVIEAIGIDYIIVDRSSSFIEMCTVNRSAGVIMHVARKPRSKVVPRRFTYCPLIYKSTSYS